MKTKLTINAFKFDAKALKKEPEENIYSVMVNDEKWKIYFNQTACG